LEIRKAANIFRIKKIAGVINDPYRLNKCPYKKGIKINAFRSHISFKYNSVAMLQNLIYSRKSLIILFFFYAIPRELGKGRNGTNGAEDERIVHKQEPQKNLQPSRQLLAGRGHMVLINSSNSHS
jgi:hypothetical protein